MASVEELIAGYIEEVLKLRFEYVHPDTDFGPIELVFSLKDLRQRLDRIEELLANAIRLKAKARRGLAKAQAEAIDAWDTFVTEARKKSKFSFSDDYSSAKERAADANLGTLMERRNERIWQEAVNYAEEGVEVIRVAQRGLSDIRQELLAQIKNVNWETSFER